MEEPSPLYADLIYDSSDSRIPFAGIDQGQHPFEEKGGQRYIKFVRGDLSTA